MKYTTEEALSEILRRRDRVVLRRDRSVLRILSVLTCGLFAALVLVIALQPGRAAEAPIGSVYGSFLLGPDAGGYVLAAVVAFALGVTVTLLSLRYRKTRHPERKQAQKNDVEEAT